MNKEHQEPVLLSVLFTSAEQYSSALSIRGNNNENTFVTLLHERLCDVDSFEISGCEECGEVMTHDGETLTVIARINEAVVASAVFEIDTTIAESHGAVLVPLTVHNILIDQCDRAIVDRAFDDRRDVVVDIKEIDAVINTSLVPEIIQSTAEVLA